MASSAQGDNTGIIRVGVIGGGQLARMMVPPAIHLGLRISVLAEDEGMSAERAADAVGDYRDPETVYAFAETVDAVTFDHEHVPGEILRELERRGKAVHPRPDVLQYAQDKILMRQKLAELGVPIPEWAGGRRRGRAAALHRRAGWQGGREDGPRRR